MKYSDILKREMKRSGTVTVVKVDANQIPTAESMKKLIENVRLDSCISNNPTYDELYEQLRLAEKRLVKQNEVCPYCGKRWYFDTEIAEHEPQYYATCETCCLNFFFDENEFTAGN